MAKAFIEQVRRFLHFLQHDLWRTDRAPESGLHAFGVESLRVIHLVLKGVKEDNCKLHASALTYSTLMALVPFLVIIFSIGKAIGFNKAEEYMRTFAAEMPSGIQDFIHRLLQIVQGVNPAALGAVGGVIFLYIVFTLLSGIEESFNQIWGVQSSRRIADKVRNYLSVLVIAPSLVLVANAGSAVILAYAGSISWLGPLVSSGIRAAPVLVLALAFVAVFVFLPNTRVSFRAAAIGGLSSAVLAIGLQFAVLKFSTALFHKYAIYGSFASVPIFLFWLHLNWTILLFGAELAFAIQNRDTYAEEQAAVRASMVSKLWVALSVMQEAVRVFESPEPAFDVRAFAKANNIPVRLMNEVVGVLAHARLIGAVAGEGPESYALLQAPEHVSAKFIFDRMVSEGASPDELGLVRATLTDEVLATVEESLDRTLETITLRPRFPGDAQK